MSVHSGRTSVSTGSSRRHQLHDDDDDVGGFQPPHASRLAGTKSSNVLTQLGQTSYVSGGTSFNPDTFSVVSPAINTASSRGGTIMTGANTTTGGGVAPHRPVQHPYGGRPATGYDGPALMADNPMSSGQRNTYSDNRTNLNERRNLSVQQEDLKAKERARRANQQTGNLSLAPGAVPSVRSGSTNTHHGAAANPNTITPGAVSVSDRPIDPKTTTIHGGQRLMMASAGQVAGPPAANTGHTYYPQQGGAARSAPNLP